MSRKSFQKSTRRGSILSLALVAIVLLMTAGLGMLQCGLQARIYAARNSDQLAAQVAADAGLTNALWTLNRNVQTRYASEDLPAQENKTLENSSATFTYEVAVPDASLFHVGGGDDDEDDEATEPFVAKLPLTYRYMIKCVGKSDAAEKTLYATVRLQGLFEYALLSNGEISLMPNTLITGYNSSDPTDTVFDVKIGTTSAQPDSIPMSPGTVIEGDVFVGVGGNPAEVIGEGGTIEGHTFALTEPVNFPTITPPALPYVGTTIAAKGATVTLRPENSGIYREIKLSAQAGSPGVLEIDGGRVLLQLDGNIDLGNDADIVIKNGSSLVLYTEGDIAMGNSAGFVNENSSGTTLKIFATGSSGDTQNFELKAKSSVFGVVYAPNADVDLYPSAKLYGAISANNISIKSNGAFYYDEALRSVSPDDEGARFVIEKWWE